jgi:hypothetical protein
MIIANAGTALMFVLPSGAMGPAFPNMPPWGIPVLIVTSLFNVICAIALVQWKKWGFWGLCASTVVAFVVNSSYGVGVGGSLAGPVGLLILYGVLQIGKENKGWPQLE